MYVQTCYQITKQVQMEHIAEGSLDNSIHDFWYETRSVSMSNKGCASVVDDVHGETDMNNCTLVFLMIKLKCKI